MTFLSAAPFGRKDFDGSHGRRIQIGRERDDVSLLKKTLRLCNVAVIQFRFSHKIDTNSHATSILKRYWFAISISHLVYYHWRFTFIAATTMIVITWIFLSWRIARDLACFSSSGRISTSVDATEDGAVDTEMRRFLRVLSERSRPFILITIIVYNVERKGGRVRGRGRKGKKETGV